MTVRFLHMADLHLGSPLRTIGAQSEAIRNALSDATYRAFSTAIDVAIDEAVDFVVIAGDLYDRESRSIRANQFAVDQFDRLNDHDIPCYLCYGNHDPLGDQAEMLELPENVHVFGHETVGIVEHPIDGSTEARIFGQSYRTSSDSRKMHEGYSPPDATVPNIGLLHTGLDPDAGKYAPCSETDLREIDHMHYWALGHIHQQRIYPGTPTIAYPGIPQGRDVTEPTMGGSFLVEVSPTDDPQVQFVPTSPIVWHDVVVDVDELDEQPSNVTDVERLLIEEAERIQNRDDEAHLPDLDIQLAPSGWSPEGHICRWTLSGRGEVYELLEEEDEVDAFLTERLRSTFDRETPFVWTESVQNRVRQPLPNIDVLREEDPVLNEFFDIVDEFGDEPEVREELREISGELWFEPDDHEEERETQLPLTDDLLDELIERAEARVVEELVVRREYVDS